MPGRARCFSPRSGSERWLRCNRPWEKNTPESSLPPKRWRTKRPAERSTRFSSTKRMHLYSRERAVLELEGICLDQNHLHWVFYAHRMNADHILPQLQHEKATIAFTSSNHFGRSALIQCQGYRCMAFQEKEGRWKHSSDQKLIQGEITVLQWIG